MFTGIIQAVGKLVASENSSGDKKLRIHTANLDLSDVILGDSIATNGVCLTVTDLPGDGFWADVSVETLDYTTLGNLKNGSHVNLEKALRASDRLGGHIVSGHVDGVGEIVSIHSDARSIRYRMRAPKELAKYIAHKGSVCIDGVSLTVNKVEGTEFELNIVPHTQQKTLFGEYKTGTRVNLEVDVIARYLERLLLGEKASDTSDNNKLTMGFLAENGFMK
ncbi:MAG TPA: riboflavin synthase [Pseudomonadales bacterium]|nr:riboflavin synthase [Pseudomonadales bacterium]